MGKRMNRSGHDAGQVQSLELPPKQRQTSALRQDRRGASAAEFALLLPVLLLILVGTIQYGVMMFTYNSMLTAARAGARIAALGSANNAAVEAMVQSMLPGWVDRDLVEVESTSIAGNQVRVEVSMPSPTSTVLQLGPMPDAIAASVVMLRES
jgi:Flp pilus assembly pilin Flp